MKELNARKKIKKEILKYNLENKKGNGGFYYKTFCDNVINICNRYFRTRYFSFDEHYSCCGYINRVIIFLTNKDFTVQG